MRYQRVGYGHVRHGLIVLIMAVLVIACRDRDRIVAPVSPVTQPPEAPAPVGQRMATVSVSNLAPNVGDTIMVEGRVGVDDSLGLASFVARLAFDPTALHFVDDVSPSGMMRVVNPQDRQVTVAAASSENSPDGRLFRLRFRVDNPTGLVSLKLAIDELNDQQFNNRLSMVRLATSLRLDRSLVSGKVIPR